MAAITAITVQNTAGFRSITPLDPQIVADQIDAVFEDAEVHAVKIGLLPSAAIAACVSERLKCHRARNLLFDPSLVSPHGNVLVSPDAVDAIRRTILPMSDAMTLNLAEAGLMLRRGAPTSLREMRVAARALQGLGPRWVLVKGGTLLPTRSADVLYGASSTTEFKTPWIESRNFHGAGSTLSAAVTASLPTGEFHEAVHRAKEFLSRVLASAHELDVGKEVGPIYHFDGMRQSEEADAVESF
jgi:hydroxymethylpyrimidine/phosphomethylpyrimidine kinase